MRRSAAGLLGLAILSLGVHAEAADIPGGPATKATLKVSRTQTDGTFEIPGDADWYRVQLAAGQTYAVATGVTFSGKTVLNLRDPAGKLVKGITIDELNGDCHTCGFEFQAKTSGAYYVELKDVPGLDSYPNYYDVAVTKDCLGSLRTTCRLRPGQFLRPHLSWEDDVDYVRMTLDKAKAYNIAAQSDSEVFHLRLLDAKGKIVLERKPSELGTIFGYRPPASGDYYLSITRENYVGVVDYTLRLDEVSLKTLAAQAAAAAAAR